MKETMTLGEFFREFTPPCALESFRKLVRQEKVPHVIGSLPYEYAVSDLMRIRALAAQRRRRSSYY